jgi:ABC-2 type transport system permease protein
MKTLTIAFKDLLIVTRDRSGFILMLVAPLALTLVVSFAFGGLGGGTGGTGLADIPVALVNLDEGSFSQILVDVFHSQDLEGLVEPVRMEDVNAARAALDADQLAAVVIIPPGFTESLTNAASETGASVVEVYANPTRPIGSGVIRSIVDTVLDRFVAGVAAGEVAIAQLVASGRIQPAEIALISQEIGQQAAAAARENELITVRGRIEGSDSTGFDFLNYMAPSMAILYLTFTMANAGRTLLAERDAGTLPRMLITPSRQASVLGGKLLGVYLTGVLQMAIVLVAGAFLFNISWGDPLPVILLTLALVGAASGWGVAIAAFCPHPLAGRDDRHGDQPDLCRPGGQFHCPQQLPRVAPNARLHHPQRLGHRRLLGLDLRRNPRQRPARHPRPAGYDPGPVRGSRVCVQETIWVEKWLVGSG